MTKTTHGWSLQSPVCGLEEDTSKIFPKVTLIPENLDITKLSPILLKLNQKISNLKNLELRLNNN